MASLDDVIARYDAPTLLRVAYHLMREYGGLNLISIAADADVTAAQHPATMAQLLAKLDDSSLGQVLTVDMSPTAVSAYLPPDSVSSVNLSLDAFASPQPRGRAAARSLVYPPTARLPSPPTSASSAGSRPRQSRPAMAAIVSSVQASMASDDADPESPSLDTPSRLWTDDNSQQPAAPAAAAERLMLPTPGSEELKYTEYPVYGYRRIVTQFPRRFIDNTNIARLGTAAVEPGSEPPFPLFGVPVISFYPDAAKVQTWSTEVVKYDQAGKQFSVPAISPNWIDMDIPVAPTAILAVSIGPENGLICMFGHTLGVSFPGCSNGIGLFRLRFSPTTNAFVPFLRPPKPDDKFLQSGPILPTILFDNSYPEHFFMVERSSPQDTFASLHEFPISNAPSPTNIMLTPTIPLPKHQHPKIPVFSTLLPRHDVGPECTLLMANSLFVSIRHILCRRSDTGNLQVLMSGARVAMFNPPARKMHEASMRAGGNVVARINRMQLACIPEGIFDLTTKGYYTYKVMPYGYISRRNSRGNHDIFEITGVHQNSLRLTSITHRDAEPINVFVPRVPGTFEWKNEGATSEYFETKLTRTYRSEASSEPTVTGRIRQDGPAPRQPQFATPRVVQPPKRKADDPGDDGAKYRRRNTDT